MASTLNITGRLPAAAHRPKTLTAVVVLAGATVAAVAAVPTDAPAALAFPAAQSSPPPAPAPETLFAEPTAAAFEMSATFGADDSFEDLLVRSGVAPSDAAAAAKLVEAAEPASVAKGIEVVLLLGEPSGKASRRLEGLRFQPGPGSRILIRRTQSGELKLAREALAVDATPQRFEGRAGASLFWSLRAAGVPAPAAREYLEALGTEVDVRKIRPDDRFDLIVDSLRTSDGEARLGPPIYAGLHTNGRQIHLVRWTVEGQSGWFDPSKPQRRVDGFKQPVRGVMTSAFGYRVHPILRFARFHQGVDFGAAVGTPVFAAADGVVTGAGWNGGHGRQVRLAHPDGVSTSYSHLSAILAAPGSRVRRGQLVGLVGSSGFSTGAHLHFEVRKNGHTVDPMSFRPVRTERLDSGELAALRARLNQLQSV